MQNVIRWLFAISLSALGLLWTASNANRVNNDLVLSLLRGDSWAAVIFAISMLPLAIGVSLATESPTERGFARLIGIALLVVSAPFAVVFLALLTNSPHQVSPIAFVLMLIPHLAFPLMLIIGGVALLKILVNLRISLEHPDAPTDSGWGRRRLPKSRRPST